MANNIRIVITEVVRYTADFTPAELVDMGIPLGTDVEELPATVLDMLDQGGEFFDAVRADIEKDNEVIDFKNEAMEVEE